MGSHFLADTKHDYFVSQHLLSSHGSVGYKIYALEVTEINNLNKSIGTKTLKFKFKTCAIVILVSNA